MHNVLTCSYRSSFYLRTDVIFATSGFPLVTITRMPSMDCFSFVVWEMMITLIMIITVVTTTVFSRKCDPPSLLCGAGCSINDRDHQPS